MASTTEKRKVLEGVIAINKPQWSSSAGVLRDLQDHFGKSDLFAPWLESEKRKMILSDSKPKFINNLKVKMGHGGTLDPMATGVLIVGLGKGTKQLGSFLDCTKSYECVVLFGAATDSYDAVGKVVSKAPYEHVTRELVEERLERFRGKILQKPSVFSALKVDGKKMYEYAREGKNIPQVAARPVEVKEIEIVEWLEPGTHEFAWPKEELDSGEQQGARKLLGIRKEDEAEYSRNADSKAKRRRSPSADDHVEGAGAQPKKPRTSSDPAMSGALPVEEKAIDQVQDPVTADASAAVESGGPAPEEKATENDAPPKKTEKAEQPVEQPAETPAVISEEKTPIEKWVEESAKATQEPTSNSDSPSPQPPAARIRMTVTSGFYVRSLCHDLGIACSSLGLMSSLVRSRQGDYTLGENVLEMSDFEKGSDVWEPLVQKQLEGFMEREGWATEELETEEEWQAKKKEFMEKRKENDRDRSYRGNNWKGNWRGRGGGGNGSGNGGGGARRNNYDKKRGDDRNAERDMLK